MNRIYPVPGTRVRTLWKFPQIVCAVRRHDERRDTVIHTTSLTIGT